MQRTTLFVLAAVLIAGASFAGESPEKTGKPEPVAPKLTPEGRRQLDEGRRLFDSGKFKEALVALQKAFEENPGDMTVNWYLGRAAYETADYETAVMTYERMLVLNPKEPRVRVELARSYFMLGLYQLARDEFNTVLESGPPAEVQARIRDYLELIARKKKRHFFSGMVGVATHWDSNPRVAPPDNNVATVFGDVLLDPETREDDDTYQSGTVSLQHKMRLTDGGVFIKSSAILYGTMYDETGDQNVMFANARSGLVYESKQLAVDLAFQFSHLTKDDEEYVNMHGVNLQLTRVFTPGVIGNLSMRFDRKDYEEPLDYKDARTRDVTGRLVVILGKNRFLPSLGYEYEDARHDEETYKNLHAGFGYEHDLPWGLVAAANYGYKEMDYLKEQGLFGRARFDKIHDVAVSLTKKIGKHFEINVSHAWTEADSNIELYEYDRRILTVGATFKF